MDDTSAEWRRMSTMMSVRFREPLMRTVEHIAMDRYVGVRTYRLGNYRMSAMGRTL